MPFEATRSDGTVIGEIDPGSSGNAWTGEIPWWRWTSGPRSAWATEQLMRMGFDKVLNLKGGIQAWRKQVDPSPELY